MDFVQGASNVDEGITLGQVGNFALLALFSEMSFKSLLYLFFFGPLFPIVFRPLFCYGSF